MDQNEELTTLRSEEVQEILTNPPSWIIRWGITLIFLLTVSILVLSLIIKYPDFVTARVTIAAERPIERVVSRQSGALEKLFVENGDTVQSGHRLAVIRNTASIEDVYLLKGIMDTITSISNEFAFPTSNSSKLVLGDIETAYTNFEKSYIDFRLFNDLAPYTNRLYDNQRSLTEIKLQLKDQAKQKELLEEEYELKKIDFERYKALYEKGVVSQQEYEAKKLNLIQIDKSINALAITISQIREAAASADFSIKDTRINQNEDYTRYISNLSQSFNALKNAIRDWEHNYVLTSSIDGTISYQEFWGEKQYINAGEVVFSIFPLEVSSLMGKLILPSQNAGKVAIGQKVLLKLDNYPYQQYGMLVGRVQNISVSPSKEGNYFVYVSIPKGTTTSYNIDLPFDQELLGNADIITEDLSVAARIFYKFKEIFKY